MSRAPPPRRVDQRDVRHPHADRQGRGGKTAAKTAKAKEAVYDALGDHRQRPVARVADHEVVSPVAEEVARDDLRRQLPGQDRPEPYEAPGAVGVEGDRVVLRVDGGDHGTERGGDVDHVACGLPWIDRHGRLKAAWLPGQSLSVKDVPGRIDHEHVVGAVAVQVRDEGGSVEGRC